MWGEGLLVLCRLCCGFAEVFTDGWVGRVAGVVREREDEGGS